MKSSITYSNILSYILLRDTLNTESKGALRVVLRDKKTNKYNICVVFLEKKKKRQ